MNESVFDELEQNGTEQQKTAPRNARTRTAQARKRNFNWGNPRLTIALAAVLAVAIMLVFILALRGCSSKPSIEGRWNLDGTTVYEFYEDGKGALVLTTMSFEFDYTIVDDVISLNFTDDRATDVTYELYLTEEFLMLTGGPDGGKTQHILKRVQ